MGSRTHNFSALRMVVCLRTLAPRYLHRTRILPTESGYAEEGDEKLMEKKVALILLAVIGLGFWVSGLFFLVDIPRQPTQSIDCAINIIDPNLGSNREYGGKLYEFDCGSAKWLMHYDALWDKMTWSKIPAVKE